MPLGLELINSNHYIATIVDNSTLELELLFEDGVGYKLNNRNTQNSISDYLKIDKIFMPVKKVDIKIENDYKNTNLLGTEYLILNITTNGSLTPHDAINQSLSIIIDIFKNLSNNRIDNIFDKVVKKNT